MAIPLKYEDVVAKLDAALAREAALRKELATLRESYESMRDRKNSIVELQQRLTVTEKRTGELEGLLQMFVDNSDDKDVVELSEHALRLVEG